MPTLGRFIQRRRIELGLTQEQLAETIGGGVRQSEISRLEHDRVALPRRQRLEQIAVALDVSLGELLARSGWAGAEDHFEPAAGSSDIPAPPSDGDAPRDEQADAVPNPAQSSVLTAALIRAERLIAVADEVVERSYLTYDRAQQATRNGHARQTKSNEIAPQ